MIKDAIENAYFYNNLSDRIKTGLDWIKNNDLEKFSDGRYEIRDGLYANVQSYITKDSALFEAHRQYIDIQYMINGSEKCGISNYSNTNCVETYNSEKDIEFLTADCPEYLILNKGEFFIFAPQDAHQPSLKNNINSMVKKVVVKVKI